MGEKGQRQQVTKETLDPYQPWISKLINNQHEMGHFRVPVNLSFKASLSAKLLSW